MPAQFHAARPAHPIRRALDPIDRSSEILFGLIMVLAITGSISVAEAGRDDIHAMLVGAIGCNLAWGIVDAVMYLMSGLAERARGLRLLRKLRGATDPIEARNVIAGSLPAATRSVLSDEELDAIRIRLTELPEPPPHPRLTKGDWLAALAVFFCVFLSTFPVVIPFILIHDYRHALRLSNLVAIIMLFGTGYSLGRYAGGHPWLTGISMVILGLALVAATIALGG
jgi:hypothetical protein